MKKFHLNIVLAAAVMFAGATLSFAQSAKEQEAKLIAVLKSDAASRKEKADACRELAQVGTKEAVPVLAALLTDEEMNHMARYALEPIPDPSVDAALREALTKAKGRPLVGVIGSIGVREDAQATDALIKFLTNSNLELAQAAARALGKIGTPAAAKALTEALPRVSEENRLSFCEGLFRCAESLAAKGQRQDAMAIYDRLRAVPEPHQVRAGGLRGAILMRGQDGIPLLIEAVRGNDYILAAAAARAAMELPVADVSRALATELPKLSADKQILVIQVLGQRGDAAAVPALSAAARSGEKRVRVAAIRALPEIGQAGAASVLVGLLGDSDREVAKAAEESLAALPGKEVDGVVLAMLKSGNADQQVDAIELIARRRMTTAVPELVKAAGSADAKVRPAALRRLGELAGPEDVSTLFDLLASAKTSQDLDAVEQALSMVCTRAGDANECANKLSGLLPKLDPAQKSTVLRVLSAVGGPAALKTVRASVDDSNPDVHATAIRALGSWRTADAAPDLLALAKTAANPTDRQLCLRSYLGLARNAELPADQRLSMCRKAADLLQSPQEKKMLLGTLGSITAPETMAVILPYLSDASVKDEATAAALGIADRLLQGRRVQPAVAAKLVDPLRQVVEANPSGDLSARAKTLLQQARTKSGQK